MNYSTSMATVERFFQRHHKPLILLFITSTLLVSFHLLFGNGDLSIIKLAVAAGAAQMLFTRFTGNLVVELLRKDKLAKWVGVLFSPFPASSLGMMLIALVSFITFLKIAPVAHWDAFILTEVVISFIVGAGFSTLFYSAVGFRSEPVRVHYRLDAERYDIFAASIIAATFLGIVFLKPQVVYFQDNALAGVYLPLFFGASSVVITYLGAVIYEFIGEKNSIYRQFVSVISALALMLMAFNLVHYFLPATWIFEGEEFTRTAVLFALQTGIVVGLISGKIVKIYTYFARKHVEALLKKPFRGFIYTVSARLFLNGFIASLPFTMMLATLLFSWYTAELFGLTLAFLGMVSNVGVSLLVTDNELNPRKLHYITLLQRRRLERLSPNFKLLLAMPMRYLLKKAGFAAR